MQLEALGQEHQDQFLNLIRDFAERDKPFFVKLFGDKTWDQKAFQKFLKDCDKQRMDWKPKAGAASLSHYVLLDALPGNGVICGYGRMRFPLDDKTEQDGGNLEFYVPPAKRGHGYGAFTLNRMLFEAVRAGLARALVTCAASSESAIKCIEKNRGERINEKSAIARFWIRFR